ncbi:hypothetical protein AVEN_127433-1 [Araneus ventricosus]|uniref:Uncharacterized protein n=1 Tax=Araneus ventricosus TaxID=182803 RepID=A0A4Y2EWG2_ARAVE|nr:hypothetical protein AVEN_127433-1 [Araneus ventricosus]
MLSKCTFCVALKFEAQASGLCCSNGKVSLPKCPQLPEPLKSFMEGNHPKSKEFLSMIRKYSSSFQTTTFGTSLPMLDSTGFMQLFEFRVKYTTSPGSLCPFPMKKRSSSKYTYLETKKLKRTVAAR